ncbi:MAG: sigma-70 family RNA polymerase sigma factor [Clostridia bacterium]|nr:sigma-70 family RNA polymerase sigma factor [Clostridia bacterium]
MIGIYLALIDSEEDKVKFQEIYEGYRKQMWYTAKEILQDDALAEDAVHDAFLGMAKIFPRIKGFSENGMRAYAVTCARNAALKYIKKNKAAEVISIDGSLSLEDIRSAEEMLEQETAELAASILEKMPPLYSEVLYLRFAADMTDKEIALQLNRKETTVRQQLMRGRRMFLEFFRKEFDYDRETV